MNKLAADATAEHRTRSNTVPTRPRRPNVDGCRSAALTGLRRRIRNDGNRRREPATWRRAISCPTAGGPPRPAPPLPHPTGGSTSPGADTTARRQVYDEASKSRRPPERRTKPRAQRKAGRQEQASCSRSRSRRRRGKPQTLVSRTRPETHEAPPATSRSRQGLPHSLPRTARLGIIPRHHGSHTVLRTRTYAVPATNARRIPFLFLPVTGCIPPGGPP